jgi:hypothetical protein
VPNGTKVLSPGSVTTSTNATAITNFEFDEPVYLNGNTEYAIVLLADTTAYTVYVAKAGDLVLGSTEARVSKQPSLGSLFLSQNSRTWTPDQERDLTFTIQRASFVTADAFMVAENRELPKFILDGDGLLSTNADSDLQVDALGHGLRVGDKVTVSGATAIAGIAANDINGDRTVISADGYGFTFRADSAANTATFGGGQNVSIIPNYQFDAVYPIVEELVPPKTIVTHQAKFMSGNSWAGSETTYGKDASYTPVTNNKLTGFEIPKMVANRANEVANLTSGTRSLTYRVKMTNQNNLVSPIIDTQRMSIVLTNNMVDKQAAVAASGFNVPLNYQAETNPQSGSWLSKHITVPVTLENTAVGLKILLAANRPSVSDFHVYYRTDTSVTTGNILDANWVLIAPENSIPSDDDPERFREYTYLPGGAGGSLDAFSAFQLKIVFESTNSTKVPIIRDLRAIALAT